MMPPEIIVTHVASSSLAGQQQRFQQSRVTLGRAADSDVQFDYDEDLLVSHRHAELYVENAILYVRDLGSRNGTYVNGRRIAEPVELKPDDAIYLGDSGPQVRAQLAEQKAMAENLGVRKTLLSYFFPSAPGEPERSDAPARPQAPPPAESLPPTWRGEAAPPAPRSGPWPPEPAESALPADVPASAAAPADRPEPDAERGQPWQPVGQRPVSQPPRRRGRGLFLLALAAALGAGIALGYRYVPTWIAAYQGTSAPEPREPADAPYVAALGRLEPVGGILNIGGPAGQTIKALLVEEGQLVYRDEPLVYLSSYDAMEAEYEQANIALDEARQQLEATKQYTAALVDEAKAAVAQTGKPLDLEIEAAEAEVALLRTYRDIAAADRRRLEESAPRPTAEQRSRQQLAEQRAERELTAGEKRLAQLRQSTELRRAQAQAQLQTAQANQKRLEQAVAVHSAERNAARAKTQWEQAIIRAPRDGKVLKILLREGAALAGRPILQVAPAEGMQVVAEVYQTDIRHIHRGQTATIASPALPESLQGTVERVRWTIGRNAVRDIEPTAPVDLRVVEVEILLDQEQVTKHRELLEKLINLEVQVRIARNGS